MNALEVETTDRNKLHDDFDYAIHEADRALKAVTEAIPYGDSGDKWSKATVLRDEVIKKLIALEAE